MSDQTLVYKIFCLNFPLPPFFPVPPACEIYFALFFKFFFFFPEGTFFYSVLISPLAFCLFTTTLFSPLVVHSEGGDYLYSSLSHPHILKCYEKGENVVPPLLAAFNVTTCLVDVEA